MRHLEIARKTKKLLQKTEPSKSYVECNAAVIFSYSSRICVLQ